MSALTALRSAEAAIDATCRRLALIAADLSKLSSAIPEGPARKLHEAKIASIMLEIENLGRKT